jgi:hypothetical protein
MCMINWGGGAEDEEENKGNLIQNTGSTAKIQAA